MIRISTIMAILVLLSGTAALGVAQHNHGGGPAGMAGMGNPGQQMPKVKTGSLKSQVVEMKEGEITVQGKYQGKAQQVTLRTDSATKMEGLIERGSKVKVQYREDMPGSLYATAVKGSKQKKS